MAPDNNKYMRSGLTSENALHILQIVLEFMEDEKPYLDPGFSIESLAENLHISRHYISQTLNQELDKNFYTFINEYRINEFKKLAHEQESRNDSIMSLAFQAGFNSKSSFNMVFKKFENKTPSQFLKNDG